MDLNDLQILPPAEWSKFEDLCLDIFREEWGDPNAQKNGRSGQSQRGVDISGRPTYAPGELHGVQCKGKDSLYGRTITKSELDEEVKKALTFQPKLQSWILVTTASKDAAIEQEARLITARHQSDNLFRVTVLGWEDIRNRIADSDTVMTKHYPDQAPRQKEILAHLMSIREESQAQTKAISLAIEAQHQQFQTTSTTLARIVSMIGGVTERAGSPPNDAEAILQARIDDVRNFISEQEPASALRQVERLIRDYWEIASDSARFRLLANKAAALFNLGRNDEGARTSLDALPFAPHDHRAIVYAAQAHIFLGEADRARAMLDELLNCDSGNEDAQALRIVASVDEDGVTDPYWVVPVPEAAAWNVTLSAARWFRGRGRHEESMAALQRVLAQQPDRLEVMADAASYTIENLFRGRAAIFGHRLNSSQRARLAWAVDRLREVWNRVKHKEVGGTYLWAANNLASALRYRNDIKEALTLISEALTLFPHCRELLQQRALVAAAQGEHAEVLTALDRLGSCDPEALLMRSDALEGLGRTNEALVALDDFPQAANPRLRVVAASSRVKLLIVLNRREEAFSFAKAIAAAFPDYALAQLVLSDAHRRLGYHSEALEHAQAAVSLLNNASDDDGLDRMILGQALGRLGDWDGAATLLADAGDPSEDSEALRLRVEALLNAGRRQELRCLLQSMPLTVSDLPSYARAGAWLYRLSGDYDNAGRCLESFLSKVPDNLSMRMLWLDVLERQDDRFAIETFLEAEADYLGKSARTRDLMALCQFMARHGRLKLAVDLGYRTLRERWSDPIAHCGYFGLMMITENGRFDIPCPNSIGPEVAFTVEDDAKSRRTYVIETLHNLKVEFNEIAADSRLARVALGGQVGDTLKVNDSDMLPSQRVVELAHKYLNLLHRSLRDYNSLFPDDSSIIGFNVDDAHPEQFIERIKPGLTARTAARQEMLRQYRTTTLPVPFAAKAMGLDPIDGWNAIRHGKVPVDVCLGTAPERDKAVTLLKTQPMLILDPLTFWIAGVLDILGALAGTFGQLGMAASTMELLEAREREALEHVERSRGVMLENDGKVVIVETTDAERREPAKLATRLLGWARTHATIVPAIPERDVEPDLRRLGELTHPSILDTLVAANGSGRVLLCEDRRLRLLGESAGITKAVWLQPALMRCLSSHSLSQIAYSDALLDLEMWGHHLISLDAATLVRATTRWGALSVSHFEEVSAKLSSPTLEPQSLLTVLLSFIAELWCQSRARATKERFTGVVLGQCRLARPEFPSRLVDLLNGLSRGQVRKVSETEARYLSQASRYVSQWLTAHGERGYRPS